MSTGIVHFVGEKKRKGIAGKTQRNKKCAKGYITGKE